MVGSRDKINLKVGIKEDGKKSGIQALSEELRAGSLLEETPGTNSWN